jgi:hypothetical protein
MAVAGAWAVWGAVVGATLITLLKQVLQTGCRASGSRRKFRGGIRY